MSNFELAVMVLLSFTFSGVIAVILVVNAIHRMLCENEVREMRRRERGEQ